MNTNFTQREVNFKRVSLILCFLTVLLLAVVIFQYYKLQTVTSEIKTKNIEISALSKTKLTDEEKTVFESQKLKEYFISNVLQTYNQTASQPIQANEIKILKGGTPDWLVVTNNQRTLFIADNITLELDTSEKSLACDLQTIDTFDTLNLDPYENLDRSKHTTLILSGECPGWGMQHFTGMYDLQTGKQIPFTNPKKFRVAEMTADYLVTTKGTATGKYVNGLNNYKTMFIEYDQLGYGIFDLQTGRMIDAWFFSDY